MEETEHYAKLTAAELSQLWTAYLADTLAMCELTYYMNTVEDNEIQELVSLALQESEAHIQQLTAIFNDNQYPVPKGFTIKEDVNLQAPRLFSDVFVLHWLNQFGKIGMNAYSLSVTVVAREDIHDYFSKCLAESNDMIKRTNKLMLSKGIFVRPPSLTAPDSIDFVKSQQFLAGWFGDVRPLTSLEITHLYANTQRNALGAAAMIGFTQTAQSKEAGRYFQRGKEIANKHIEIFSTTMRKNDLPAITTMESEVTDSKVETFSDKLMMYKGTVLIGVSLGYYGMGMSGSPRRDIGIHYGRLMVEIAKYAEDGANILIKNGWMEEPPRALDRDELNNT